MLAFLSSSWDILLASQSLSRVLFRILSVPTCGSLQHFRNVLLDLRHEKVPVSAPRCALGCAPEEEASENSVGLRKSIICSAILSGPWSVTIRGWWLTFFSRSGSRWLFGGCFQWLGVARGHFLWLFLSGQWLSAFFFCLRCPVAGNIRNLARLTF